MTARPNSVALDAIQNQFPRVHRHITANSIIRLTQNAQNVQKNLSSGTVNGVTIRDAATQREARTIKIQFSEVPNTKLIYRQTSIGIINEPETAEPTAAERRLKRLIPYSITSFFSLRRSFSISVCWSLRSTSWQVGHSCKCSFTRLRLFSLQASSVYSGSRSQITSQSMFMIHTSFPVV